MPHIAPPQPTPTTVRLAAAQPLSAKARRMLQLPTDAAGRAAHFQKYNLGAATYDEGYCRPYGEEYLTYLESWAHRAAGRNVNLLLFPEFCFVPGVLAAPAPGAPANPNAVADAVRLYSWSGALFSEQLCRWSRETGMFIGAATFTVREGRIYNTGLLADEHGRMVLRYDKIHLPQDEAEHVTPGTDYTVADTRLGRIGFAICYDCQFPEHAACLAVRGAQLVLHPSAGYTIPDERPDMGRNRLRVRASDHYAAWVYASFSPQESGGPGSSSVIAANGDLLASVAGQRTGLAVGDTVIGGTRAWPGDTAAAPNRESIRRRCRRPSTYQPLLHQEKLS